MTTICEIQLRKILDSRGNPTVEADIYTENGFGRAAAPSGASTGLYEAKVVEPDVAIEQALKNLIPSLIGEDSRDQVVIDGILRDVDGTADFSTIGANVAVAISLANARAAASSLGMELFQYLGGVFVPSLPLPIGNVIGGGAHAENATEIQEFLVVATGASGPKDAVFANAAVHRKIKELLKEQGKSCGKGDEGAWAPQLRDEEAFELVNEAVSEVSDVLDISIRIGLDLAASQLWNDDGTYHYRDRVRTPEEQIAYICELVDRYDLIYVED
ncbi:MAG: enolase, partial [Methanoregulaceae archaeon]|nr:enolase [Methanoregulaceae archaeon]